MFGEGQNITLNRRIYLNGIAFGGVFFLNVDWVEAGQDKYTYMYLGAFYLQ